MRGVGRRWRAGVLVLLLCVAVGVVAFVHWHRFSGGPLADPSFGGIGSAGVRLGRPLAFTEIYLSNHSGRDIVLEHVRPLETLPGTAIRVWGVKPGMHVAADGLPFPPPPKSAIVAIDQFVVPAHARDVQLVEEVTPTRRGCFGVNGLVIDYHAGFKRYRRVARQLFMTGGTKGASKGCDRPPGKG